MQTKLESKQHLSFQLELKEGGVDEQGRFSGYANVFNVVDGHNDVVLPGAFAKSIADYQARGKKVKLCWQHNMSLVIGTIDVIREDAKGLYVEGMLVLDTQQGKEAHALLKAGAIDSMSIGYVTKVSRRREDNVRELMELDLYEISLVTWPANEQALVTAVKEKRPATIREMEDRLRDAGLSRKDATTAAPAVFQALGLRDADTEAEAVKQLIRRNIEQLKG